MVEWKKNLHICQYCEKVDDLCEEVMVETETNPKRKLTTFKCKEYVRDEEK